MADIQVNVGLSRIAARADVDVERKRRLKEAGIVNEDLAFALPCEIPDQANARLEVVLEVVELQVSHVTSAVGLLVVPAQTEVELHILGEFEVVLNVEALDVRAGVARSGLESEVTHARGTPNQERVGADLRHSESCIGDH